MNKTTRLPRRISNYWIITILLIVVKLSLHFLTNTNYELHRDEMLFFNMADHPDFGYVSVPPFTGVLAYIIKVIVSIQFIHWFGCSDSFLYCSCAGRKSTDA
jgi:hypothetical protein